MPEWSEWRRFPFKLAFAAFNSRLLLSAHLDWPGMPDELVSIKHVPSNWLRESQMAFMEISACLIAASRAHYLSPWETSTRHTKCLSSHNNKRICTMANSEIYVNEFHSLQHHHSQKHSLSFSAGALVPIRVMSSLLCEFSSISFPRTTKALFPHFVSFALPGCYFSSLSLFFSLGG